MEKEYFDSLIENISGQLQMFYDIKEKEKTEFNMGVVAGMYYVADSIQNMLITQNDVNDENNYKDFIDLVEKIEKNLK